MIQIIPVIKMLMEMMKQVHILLLVMAFWILIKLFLCLQKKILVMIGGLLIFVFGLKPGMLLRNAKQLLMV